MQGNEIRQLELSGAGNAARHELTLTTTSDLGAAQIALGREARAPLASELCVDASRSTRRRWPTTDFAAWQLREPARGRVSAAAGELAQTCWQSGTADLCVEGVASTGSHRSRVFALGAAVRLFRRRGGRAGADRRRGERRRDVRATIGRPAAVERAAHVFARSARIRRFRADEPYALGFGPIEGHVTIADDRIAGQLSLPFEQQGQLELEARVGAGAARRSPSDRSKAR